MEIKPAAIEKRAEKLLAAMTLDEKLDYLGGYQDFYIRPIERLSLPAIKMADGPSGCRNDGPANAYPCPLCLAATWNPERAEAQGMGLGRDCRARGVHILLAPGVNIHRSPLCGRNFEYMGEDPFLAAYLAVPLIRGIQDQGVLGTVKHYAANSQEYGRHTISSDMDERTLREIYLPAFRAAVQEAKVACVMSGYNLVNGVHCTEHSHLNNDILKEEWGFDGILMSDWNSTYDGVAAANGGLDLEMPFAKLMTRETLKAALETAREGLVLLKNNRKLLPLDVKKHRKIALIGPNAHPLSIGGGGSSAVTPFRSSSVFDALSLLAGEKASIGYEAGGTLPDYSSLFKNSTFECCAPDGTVQAGRKYEIRIEYDEAAGWAAAQFGWDRADALKGDHASAVRLAAESDVAIVCVGFNTAQECEGFDRTFELPPTQADLIRAVQKVNPNTVVVLFAGGTAGPASPGSLKS